MWVVLCPDKFRDCLPAPGVVAAMADGVRDADPSATVDPCPMADGGEGTVDAILGHVPGRRVVCHVTGPLPERKVDAAYALLDDGTAVVEVAVASGLALLAPADRDPLRTTTFGTGELIADAVRRGAERVVLALGGSGTVDGGLGCLQACGFTILTVDGEPTSPTDPLCGRDLDRVLMIKRGRGEVTNRVPIVAACDVVNPLCGPTGAARSFGPQKGATPDAVEWLDGQLARLSRDHVDAANRFGSGAAGGLGFAVAAYFAGTLTPGFDVVADAVGLRDRLRSADLCLTGEGRIDATTAGGKAVAGVARLAAAAGVPCVAIAGVVADAPIELTAAFAIADGPITAERSRADAARLIRRTAGQVVRLWQSGRR